MTEDRCLMTKFQEGNKESFEQLIIKYRAQAVSFAKRFLHDAFIAEDIVQESFAYVYVYRDKYNSKYSFKTYLFTIIRNKSIDYIRKQNNLSLYEEVCISDSSTPEEILLKKDDNAKLKLSINKLKDDYKMAIHLIDYERFSYSEAAKIMGKNSAQMKILIYRARKKLKSILLKEGYTIGSYN